MTGQRATRWQRGDWGQGRIGNAVHRTRRRHYANATPVYQLGTSLRSWQRRARRACLWPVLVLLSWLLTPHSDRIRQVARRCGWRHAHGEVAPPNNWRNDQLHGLCSARHTSPTNRCARCLQSGHNRGRYWADEDYGNVKISELIKTLQFIQSQHINDVPVQLQSEKDGEIVSTEDFFVNEEEYENRWRVSLRDWPY